MGRSETSRKWFAVSWIKETLVIHAWFWVEIQSNLFKKIRSGRAVTMTSVAVMYSEE